MTFAAGFATGWIGCLAFLAALVFIAAYVCITGQFPRLKWPGEDGPDDE